MASVAFPFLQTARTARDRLARAGFARSSIDIARYDDAFAVSISTRDANRDRAERILAGSPLGEDLRHAGGQAAELFHANRPLASDLAALAGIAPFGLTKRR